MAALRADEKMKISKASSDQIQLGFGLLENNFVNKKFLSDNNFLSKDTAQQVEKQFKKKPIKRRKFLAKYTKEYISASTVVHNFDGWAYFQHAVYSILRGDGKAAQHMLYYSELRSAMSILATQGIGIFSRKHLVLKANGKVDLINEKFSVPGPTPGSLRSVENTIGTHDFVWQAFEEFFSIRKNREGLANSFHVEGFTLDRWMDGFGVSKSMKDSIIIELIKRLSFDLGHFSKDREARNEASYRPSRVSDLGQLSDGNRVLDIYDMWQLSEPQGFKGEVRLDFLFLSEILQIAFKQTSGFSVKQAPVKFKRTLTQLYASIGITGQRCEQLTIFFTQNNKSIFDLLAITDTSSRLFTKGIFFRSFFLLRLSSVYCKMLISTNPKINKKLLEFWWESIGLDFGLWDQGLSPGDFADLWLDFESISEAFKAYLDEVGENGSVREFWAKVPDVGLVATTCSRIGFWGLGL